MESTVDYTNIIRRNSIFKHRIFADDSFEVEIY